MKDELWQVLEPLLPPQPPKPKGGRLRLSDRAALEGILFVLRQRGNLLATTVPAASTASSRRSGDGTELGARQCLAC
jgi:transposase